ncbi:MAG: MarR family transcriptional regulator [Oscillospiraceae bacterium]|nr:MarR family transcriptional regulator [Oscillospiraceae bacterium]
MTNEELLDGILEYCHIMSRQMKQVVHQLVLDCPISPMQMNILHILLESESGGMKISQLSRILEVTNSNISAICQRLEKAELVRRTRDAKDQRVVIVTPTPKARELMKHMEVQIRSSSRSRLQHLSREQLEVIYFAFKTISETEIDSTE